MQTEAVHTAEITKLRLEGKTKLEKERRKKGKRRKKHRVVRGNIVFLRCETASQLL
jgi:hypothetical protein